jgi:hypothetical protein
MRSPFSNPQTPGQWLLGSVCWTTVCVGGWLLIAAALIEVPFSQRTPDEPLVFVWLVALVVLQLLWLGVMLLLLAAPFFYNPENFN